MADYNLTHTGAQIDAAITKVEEIYPDLPSYYLANNYLQDKCSAINSHSNDCNYGGFTLAFITDTHWDSNAKKSPLLMKYLCEHTCLRNIVFGGDAYNQEDTKALAIYKYNWFREAFNSFKSYHWLPIIGNHELNNPGASAERTAITLTKAEAYGMVVKENENIINVIDEYSYYIDNANTKIRFIFVGCSYASPIPSSTSAAVASVIGNLPSGYKVAVFSHVGMNGTGSTGTIDSSFQPIVTALEAVVSNVIGCFVGNRHADGYVLSSGGVPVIATTCDAMQEDGGLSRASGTITEQAFDVIQYSPSLGKIYLTRIGAGQNREYNSGKLEYGGIECGIDNSNYEDRNGLYTDTTEHDERFISVMVDTELTEQRTLSFVFAKVREFNDPNSVSVDYWTPNAGSSPRTFTSSSRYFAISVGKESAADCYLHDDTNDVYLFKGDNV